jgi:tight adherence protein B
VFLVVTGTVFLFGWLWERQRLRDEWQRVAAQVERATGRHPAAAPAPAARLRRDAKPSGWEGRVLRRFPPVAALAGLLEQAGLAWGVVGFLKRALGFGAVLALVLLLVSGPGPLVLAALPLGGLPPLLQALRARARRMARFEESFPDAVDLIGRAIKAGHPFQAGLRMVADEAGEPIADEFRRIFEEQKFGLGLEDSLQGLAARVPLVDVRIFVTAVLVQREVGGNLSEILDRITITVRDRFQIQRQVKVFTAQGRLTGVLLSLMPVGLGGILMIVNPDYMMLLFQESMGQAMLAVAATMQGIGYLLIRRITDIQV